MVQVVDTAFSDKNKLAGIRKVLESDESRAESIAKDFSKTRARAIRRGRKPTGLQMAVIMARAITRSHR